MSELLTYYESDPPLLGNTIIDGLRLVQAAANELGTLEERKQFAMSHARPLSVADLQGVAWSIETEVMAAKGLNIERDEWAVVEKRLSLFARIKKMGYLFGAAIPNDGLALILDRVNPFALEPDAYNSAANRDGITTIGSLACAPVMSLTSIKPAREN